jgi:predicted nucleic acid-binding protein
MILVDANILMYAAGAPHRHKAPSLAWLERVAAGEIEAGVDAETLQEILHRYRAIGRWKDGRQVYDLARAIFPSVLPITSAVTDRARAILDRNRHCLARDALHAAVVQVHQLEAICSYDRDFDRLGVRRVEP